VETSKSNAFRLAYDLDMHLDDKDVFKVYNHLNFVVRFHEQTVHLPERMSGFSTTVQETTKRCRIIRFEVQPESRAYGCLESNCPATTDTFELSAASSTDVDIPFTCSVRVERSDMR